MSESTNGSQPERQSVPKPPAAQTNGIIKAHQQDQNTTQLITLNALPAVSRHLAIDREPEVILQEAQRAARALSSVIAGKPKPVMFNGEQYLEFEDWQTVGRFYGLTAKVRESRYVEFGDVRGFEAIADVLIASTGQVISSAESMCLNDEPKWSQKPKYEGYGRNRRMVGHDPVPLFQLRSMSQTRACAKALRNVLSWVVVLAGYRTTPAEEMDSVPGFDGCSSAPPDPDPRGYEIETGGAPYGSREAAENVAKRKLAQQEPEPKPPASEAFDLNEAVARITEYSRTLAPEVYADILAAHGINDARQLRSRLKCKQVWVAMETARRNAA